MRRDLERLSGQLDSSHLFLIIHHNKITIYSKLALR
jgi:hypothetical protein